MSVDQLGNYTLIGIPLLLGIILIIDVYLYAKGGTEATLSAKIVKRSYTLPFLPFMVGFIIGLFCGHLFWQMPGIL